MSSKYIVKLSYITEVESDNDDKAVEESRSILKSMLQHHGVENAVGMFEADIVERTDEDGNSVLY